jgi:hypothetical protein
MSQLGLMVIAIGLSSYNIALFHLVNHAFYKALLFLGAGSVIHAVADNQDLRKYGGLISHLPLTYSVMFIASLSLVAFPFMTGFYSKDFILESAYGLFTFSGISVYVIATIGAIFTTLYSVKVLYLTFLSRPNGSLQSIKHADEGNIFMTLPLIILALLSIFFGFITKDIFIGLGSNFFSDSLFIHPIHEIMIDTEFAVPTIFKLLPFIFTILFSFIALVLYEFLGATKLLIYFKLSRFGYNIFGFFNQRFFVEFFYNKYITNFVLKLGEQTSKILDKGSIESLGGYGLEKVLLKLSKNFNKLNTSIVTNYALFIFLAFILNIILFEFKLYNYIFILIYLLLNTAANNNDDYYQAGRSEVLATPLLRNKVPLLSMAFIADIDLSKIKLTTTIMKENVYVFEVEKKAPIDWESTTEYISFKDYCSRLRNKITYFEPGYIEEPIYTVKRLIEYIAYAFGYIIPYIYHTKNMQKFYTTLDNDFNMGITAVKVIFVNYCPYLKEYDNEYRVINIFHHDAKPHWNHDAENYSNSNSPKFISQQCELAGSKEKYTAKREKIQLHRERPMLVSSLEP